MYGLLFLIVFAETGFIVTPFLPGDSLLFAAGIFSRPIGGSVHLDIAITIPVLILAALCGDNVNYWVGRLAGPRLFKHEHSKIFKKSHLEKTQAFFERHGSKTIILARFVPIVRTFTPFVAGMSCMPYPKFLAYSVFAACLWVGLCVGMGYAFGGIGAVKQHFEVAALAIVALSLLPMIIELVRHRRNKKSEAAKSSDEQQPGAA
ncbi:MAG: rane-associated protein [Fimbriimonadaceae bacterium]|nr:rane-associated protein [Fimbriimonadaceae bacterium]